MISLSKQNSTRARRRRALRLTSLRSGQRLAERQFAQAMRALEPIAERSFLAAIDGIRDELTAKRLIDAIDEGRLDDVVDLDTIGRRFRGFGLEPGVESFADHLSEAFRLGTVSGIKQIPRVEITKVDAQQAMVFDRTNPEAARHLLETIPDLIVQISTETKEAIQDTFLFGLQSERTGVQIARDIRGMIGLTRKQAEAVRNLRLQLELGMLGGATPPWERRLSAVEQARARRLFDDAAEGRPLSPAQIDALVERYEQSLINRRARNIARTELHDAFEAGKAETWRQAEEAGLLDRDTVRREWLVTRDDRLRDDHRAVPTMNPDGVGLDEPFQTPVGPIMRPGLGPPGFAISCRCVTTLRFSDE